MSRLRYASISIITAAENFSSLLLPPAAEPLLVGTFTGVTEDPDLLINESNPLRPGKIIDEQIPNAKVNA